MLRNPRATKAGAVRRCGPGLLAGVAFGIATSDLGILCLVPHGPGGLCHTDGAILINCGLPLDAMRTITPACYANLGSLHGSIPICVRTSPIFDASSSVQPDGATPMS